MFCKHRWMIVNDYWNKGIHIIKYRCINCSKEYTQKEEMDDHEGK